MEKKTKTKEVYLGLAGLIGLILIIILATTLTPGPSLEGNLNLKPASSNCSALNLTSIPSPIKSRQSSIIVVKPDPQSWEGRIRISASGGILNDGTGNEGSIIETGEKILSYGGGETGDRITVQAVGSGNEQCLGTIDIQASEAQSCVSLKISTDPAILTANQSAVLKVSTNPPDYSGGFLFQADSGKFQMTYADPNAMGENTGTLVTSNKTVIFNGGGPGDEIRVAALGENNPDCKDSLEIRTR